MLTLYLIIFLLSELLSQRFLSGAPRLFIQISFSLLSGLTLILSPDLGALNLLNSNFYDLFVVVGLLLSFGLMRMYRVISTEDKSASELTNVLIVLLFVAIPFPIAKILFLMLLISLSVRREVQQVELSCWSLVALTLSLVYFLNTSDYLQINTYTYLILLVGVLKTKRISHFLLANSIAVGVGVLPLWMIWLGASLVMSRMLIYTLDQCKIVNFNNFNLSRFRPLQRLYNNQIYQKESQLAFKERCSGLYKFKHAVGVNGDFNSNSIIGQILIWSIVLFLGVTVGGYV